MDKNIVDGPTGRNLLGPSFSLSSSRNWSFAPSKIYCQNKKHLSGNLPVSYQRNFTKGFDGFLCLHLGVEPDQVIECVKSSASQEELEDKLKRIFPADLKPHIWNRKVVQMGTADMAKEKLAEVKTNLGAGNREDLISFADVIDFDERKIT